MVFYYPPTTPMPAHRWGVGFASTLPWLWGEGSAKVAVGEARVQEAHLRQQAVDAETRAELQVAVATARREHTLLRLLEERSLPAARRAEVAASTGYAAGRAPLLEWMMARTAVTDSELDLAMARAALEHTMVELRFAAGSGATAHEGVRHVP
jgi:outer membrane protein TolC